MKTEPCAWMGQGEGCTQSAVPGRNYCEHHLWIVYKQGSALSPRHKDRRKAENIRTWASLMNEAVTELEDEGRI